MSQDIYLLSFYGLEIRDCSSITCKFQECQGICIYVKLSHFYATYEGDCEEMKPNYVVCEDS